MLARKRAIIKPGSGEDAVKGKHRSKFVGSEKCKETKLQIIKGDQQRER